MLTIRSHLRAVSFFIFLPGVLAGDWTSVGPLKDIPLGWKRLLPSASVLLLASKLDFLEVLVGDRHCSSRSRDSSLQRSVSFSLSSSVVSGVWSGASSWTIESQLLIRIIRSIP